MACLLRVVSDDRVYTVVTPYILLCNCIFLYAPTSDESLVLVKVKIVIACILLSSVTSI